METLETDWLDSMLEGLLEIMLEGMLEIMLDGMLDGIDCGIEETEGVTDGVIDGRILDWMNDGAETVAVLSGKLIESGRLLEMDGCTVFDAELSGNVIDNGTLGATVPLTDPSGKSMDKGTLCP